MKMPKIKSWTLLAIFIIGILPCLPFIYGINIFNINGSVFFAILGFGLISITLIIHQLLIEKLDN